MLLCDVHPAIPVPGWNGSQPGLDYSFTVTFVEVSLSQFFSFFPLKTDKHYSTHSTEFMHYIRSKPSVVIFADMFSISSNDDDMMLKQSDSRGSYLSSKPSLSDIYERSDEGDLEKKIGSSASAAGISSATNSFNMTGSQSR